jgi:hypothetical protein
LTVTKEMVDKLITKNGGDAGNWFNMYSWTLNSLFLK